MGFRLHKKKAVTRTRSWLWTVFERAAEMQFMLLFMQLLKPESNMYAELCERACGESGPRLFAVVFVAASCLGVYLHGALNLCGEALYCGAVWFCWGVASAASRPRYLGMLGGYECVYALWGNMRGGPSPEDITNIGNNQHVLQFGGMCATLGAAVVAALYGRPSRDDTTGLLLLMGLCFASIPAAFALSFVPTRTLEKREQAAAQGDADEQYHLGKMYLNGDDLEQVQQDRAKGIKLLQQSAAQNHRRAIEALQDLPRE